MNKQDIWMPLFIGDYLRDTTRLSTEQHGAYFLLIMDYWVNGAPPDDDATLANITKMQIQAWRKAKTALSKLFKIEDGVWHHKRIDEELSNAASNADKYAKRAKKAADARWNKNASSNANSNASSIPPSKPKAMPESVLADATSPSPSSTDVSNTQSNSNVSGITPAASVCLALKELGILDVNPSHPTLIALLEAGATVEEFRNFASTSKVKKFNYVLTSVANIREDALKFNPSQGQVKPKEDVAWRSNDSAIVAKANKLGISTIGKDRFQLLSAIDNKIAEQRQLA